MVDAGGSEAGKNRHQVRRRFDSRLPLNVAEVRAALHSHFAVRPRLPGRPLDGIVAVVLFLAERIPLALGLVPPAHILVDENITAPREEYGNFVGGGIPFRTV